MGDLMEKLTRRAILRGTPAAAIAAAAATITTLPSIALAAVEPQAPTPLPAADAELLRLEAERTTARRAHKAAVAAREAAMGALPEWARYEIPHRDSMPPMFSLLLGGDGLVTLRQIR